MSQIIQYIPACVIYNVHENYRRQHIWLHTLDHSQTNETVLEEEECCFPDQFDIPQNIGQPMPQYIKDAYISLSQQNTEHDRVRYAMTSFIQLNFPQEKDWTLQETFQSFPYFLRECCSLSFDVIQHILSPYIETDFRFDLQYDFMLPNHDPIWCCEVTLKNDITGETIIQNKHLINYSDELRGFMLEKQPGVSFVRACIKYKNSFGNEVYLQSKDYTLENVDFQHFNSYFDY